MEKNNQHWALFDNFQMHSCFFIAQIRLFSICIAMKKIEQKAFI